MRGSTKPLRPKFIFDYPVKAAHNDMDKNSRDVPCRFAEEARRTSLSVQVVPRTDLGETDPPEAVRARRAGVGAQRCVVSERVRGNGPVWAVETCHSTPQEMHADGEIISWWVSRVFGRE